MTFIFQGTLLTYDPQVLVMSLKNGKHKEEGIPTATHDGRDSFIYRENAA